MSNGGGGGGGKSLGNGRIGNNFKYYDVDGLGTIPEKVGEKIC
jgi:hypothetical protein